MFLKSEYQVNREAIFDDLKSVKNRNLRFDFHLIDHNILIEIDGK